MAENNVKLYVGESRHVIGEINDKIDFTIARLGEYSNMLNNIQTKGIKDNLIRARLGKINEELIAYRGMLHNIKAELAFANRKFNNCIKDVDIENFYDFVQGELSSVEAILGRIS